MEIQSTDRPIIEILQIQKVGRRKDVFHTGENKCGEFSVCYDDVLEIK